MRSIAIGLANESDGLKNAVYSGIATYSTGKVSNPIAAATASKVIQKIPVIVEKFTTNEEQVEKK